MLITQSCGVLYQPRRDAPSSEVCDSDHRLQANDEQHRRHGSDGALLSDWRQRGRVYRSGVQRHASPAVAIRSAANSTAVGQPPALSPSGYPPQIRQRISKLLSLSLLVRCTAHAANGWEVENRKFPAQPSRLHWMTARQLRVRSTFEAFCSS